MRVYCHECGKPVVYADAWVGENPFRFYCYEHREVGECTEQVAERESRIRS